MKSVKVDGGWMAEIEGIPINDEHKIFLDGSNIYEIPAGLSKVLKIYLEGPTQPEGAKKRTNGLRLF